ncbi:putative membrane protein [Oikeobacillus pervagus]|uniref:Membrane protein n=1 Tax=Oikeobacillus pervagus TaxID=1325931 RepID=A0AAJ1WKJ9_9BACI|nr:cytochrome c oxidase assembly factor CtaG [Oikeobacillus pervagus]MDQ0215206.1 putative membrane protein [Oikeobacillus pervagus]
MPIGIFGFQALWSPFFIIALLFLTVVYFLITVKWRKDFKESKPLTKKQATYFVMGVILLYATKGSPLDLMGHIMFTYHMVQMALLFMIVVPLLMKGIPPWLWRAIINVPVVKPIFNLFTKPLIAVVLFNGIFSFYHIPLIFDTIKLSETMHGLYTFMLFVLAIFMWWPIINELGGKYELSGLKKVGYIFADGALLLPACALIIFASEPMYVTYSDASAWLQAMQLCVPVSTLEGLNLSGPELFSNMPVLEDQQLGGIVMKIIQEVVYGVVLARIFVEWYRKEGQKVDEIDSATIMQNNNPRVVK